MVRRLIPIATLISACLAIAPMAHAATAFDGSGDGSGQGGGSVQISASVLACMKRVLTPAQIKLVKSNPDALTGAAKRKALACYNSGGHVPAHVAKTGAWLTVNPVDLSHVTAMSQFRSCAGHDYSGPNIAGAMESDRSMKHYLVTDVLWSDSGAITGYAPFAGTVQITPEHSGIGKQLRIYNERIGWSFVLFHTMPLVANGTRVSAGQPVATWPGEHTADMIGNATPTVSFDFALVAANGAVESPFLHMTPGVAAQYAAKGFTADNLIVSKAERDAAPCNGVWRDTPGGTGYVAAG